MICRRGIEAASVSLLSLLTVACQQSMPTSTKVMETRSVSAVISEPTPSPEVSEPEAIGPITFTGTVERLPLANRLGRLTGLWTVEGRTVRVNGQTDLMDEDVSVGDVVQVSGLQLTDSFVIAVAILDAPPPGDTIQLDRTVPSQSAGRLQISVQIPPDQLITPQFTIPATDPEEPDAVFERTSIELFPGFTSYAAGLNSSFTLVEFDQLDIEGVTNADCVIVHEPSFDPLVPANQFAASGGCDL